MPFFSVIIPTFNRASLIRKTLESVLRQDFLDYEILVVDDGSTDDTLKVLNAYADRVQIFHQANQGPGAARNKGIQKAQGQYTAFLDSDDLWFPWTLRACHNAIQQAPNTKFLAGNVVFFKDENDLDLVCSSSSSEIHLFPDYYASSQRSFWLGTCSAVIIQTEILQQVGGFTNRGVNAEDADLWLRLGTIEGFGFIKAPALFAYRQHSGSAISDMTKTYHGIQYLIEQEKTGQYPGEKARHRERLEILTRHIRPVSLAYLRQGEIAKAWQFYQQTLRWHLELGRIRYLLGFLGLMGLALVPKFSSGHKTSSKSLKYRN